MNWDNVVEFSVHGSLKIEMSGQVIIAQVGGPWNLELIRLFRNMITPYINQISEQGEWGLIVHVTDSAMCPPDALSLIKKGADIDISNTKRVCTSYVISPDTEGYNLMLPIWYDIYTGKIPFEIFDTIDQAINWVNDHL